MPRPIATAEAGSLQTVPALFAASHAAWGNNAYLGQHLIEGNGAPGCCFEWESYREVQLSVLAIARSLRCVLRDAVVPGMRVAIMGPATIEAVKIWQACCHLSATPLLLPSDGSIPSRQLQAVLASGDGVTAVFVHENSLAALAEALAPATTTTAAQAVPPGSPATGSADDVKLQLVVVWGAGGIRYTQPDAGLAAALVARGVRQVIGFEDFKRSHFNAEPEAAFAELLLPGPEGLAAVVVASEQQQEGQEAAPNQGGVVAADSSEAGRREMTHQADSVPGLQLTAVSHGELVAQAAALLRRRFPGLQEAKPYVPEELDGSEWRGRPHFPTCHLADVYASREVSTGLASLALLTRLTAVTATAGRAGCCSSAGGVAGDDNSVLQPDVE